MPQYINRGYPFPLPSPGSQTAPRRAVLWCDTDAAVIWQRGASLLEMLLALALGTLIILVATSNHTVSNMLLHHAEQRLGRLQRVRVALRQLVEDSRLAGRFGCAPRDLSGFVDRHSLPLVTRYLAHIFKVHQVHTTSDGQHLLAVTVDAGSDALRWHRLIWVIASCARYDIVSAAHGVGIEHDGNYVTLVFPTAQPLRLGTALDPSSSHHLPSLQVATLVERRYQLYADQLQLVEREIDGSWGAERLLLDGVRRLQVSWSMAADTALPAAVHFHLELDDGRGKKPVSHKISVALDRSINERPPL